MIHITIELNPSETADDAVVRYVNHSGDLFEKVFEDRFNEWGSRDVMLKELAGLLAKCILKQNDLVTLIIGSDGSFKAIKDKL